MLLKYFPPKNKHGNESTDVGQPANKQTKIMKNLYNTTEGEFSVFRTICGFHFIPWERVIFFYMGIFSWKGRATPEKN
jgi:hypothetical protein